MAVQNWERSSSRWRSEVMCTVEIAFSWTLSVRACVKSHSFILFLKKGNYSSVYWFFLFYSLLIRKANFQSVVHNFCYIQIVAHRCICFTIVYPSYLVWIILSRSRITLTYLLFTTQIPWCLFWCAISLIILHCISILVWAISLFLWTATD